MVKFNADNGEVRGSLSTGPRYSPEELPRGQPIRVSDQGLICYVQETEETEQSLYVHFIHDSCPFVHRVHVSKVEKIDPLNQID